MEFRKIDIELFGEQLVLHERTAADIHVFHEYVRDNFPDQKVDPITNTMLSIEILRDALKLNIYNLKRWRFFRKFRLKRKLSSKYLLQHLTPSQIHNLVKTVIEELEKTESSEKKKPSQ